MAEYDQNHQPTVSWSEPRAASSYRHAVFTAGPSAARAGLSGWMRLGACRSEDPELFFPATSASLVPRQVRSAKAVCARCPVQANCLSYALITGQDEGIWGGTTWAERWPSRHLARLLAELAGLR